MHKNNILLFTCLFVAGMVQAQPARPVEPARTVGTAKMPVIFDTDFGPDYDDVGAIALLHAFADSGYIDILATGASCKHKNAAAALNVFNTYFNRPAIPIGILKGPGIDIGDWQHWTDTVIARYPHIIRSNDEVPDAVTVYRRVLAKQPDHSVTIITVGFLTNMANLLASSPDTLSPLNGKELVGRKVMQLVSMAGKFPGGWEFNVQKDAASSKFVFSNWPTRVIFSGWEIGMKIHCGLPLIHDNAIRQDPVKDVFAISIPLSREDISGRMSWDETAVLIAVKGWSPYYTLVSGKIICNDDGSNGWDTAGKNQFYVREKMPPENVQALIDRLIRHQPASDKYDRKEVMIPMRDGISLHTVIFTPRGQTEALPFLMERTPYGANKYPSPEKVQYMSAMADEGYIFVIQDIRGRYGSQGIYVMQRLPRNKKDPKAIDESTDTYDTFDWLLQHVPHNNGKAGMHGTSYDGWTTIMGAIEPHPALKAVSEQASHNDMFIGDDFHHNGAFRLSYSFEYAFMEEISKTDSLFPFSDYDTYDWYLKLGPLSNVNKDYFFGKLPSWNNFVLHPNYDSYWKERALAYVLDSPRVPILNVAGWWDQEDFYGPVKTYETLEKQDRHHYNHLVAGPWNHGGWGWGPGDKLGNISFDSATGEYFRKQIQARWFAWYLKGKGDGNFAEAITFQTGSNTWKTYDSWPPRQAKIKPLYFAAGGKLSFDKPTDQGDRYDSYISDPAHPVPYRNRPIEETYGPGSRWYTWLTEDQRFVQNRPDVLSWETDTLQEDLTVTGALVAKLYAATTGSDADWVVKLIDVYPQHYPKEPKMAGYEFMIANDVLRGRFRKSYEKPEAIVPGKIEEYTVDLHTQDHVFKKGHKIMVQVQSTWFPIIDRNPQKYVPNIFEAKEEDFQVATQKIYRTAAAASRVELEVME